MPESQTKKTKKGKPKMFLLFLFVTTFIWFLSKFSREFTANLEAEIKYTNVPHGVIVSGENYKLVTFDLTASGFDFLFYKINKPVVEIDIKKFIKDGKSKISISNSDFYRIITSQLKNDINIKNISIESMEVLLDKLKTKRVKISLLENIQYQKGFKSIGKYKLTPDSIDISGPTHHLDTLNEIATQLLVLTNVSENISTQVDLNISSDLSISFSQQSIGLDITVKEFTQKTMLLPITINNLPQDITIQLIPKDITILFDVSMEEFNKITASDFTVICDFEKKNDQENFMIPQLLKKPESIQNFEFKENKVKYLVFK